MPLPGPDTLEIDAESLKSLLDGAEPLRLVDCREPDEHAYCRIDGAELIPLSRFGEEAAGRLTDPAQPVVVYCHHGMRSLAAVQFLRKKGHPLTWSLSGGIEAWSTRIDPAVPRY